MPIPLPPEVEVVVIQAPALPPLGGEAVFDVQTLGGTALQAAPRLDAALRQSPAVSLFRRSGSDAANPTIQGVSLRAIAPSGAGRALVTLDGAPQNDPFGGWVIWSALPPESVESVSIVQGAGAGAFGAGALTGVIALRDRSGRDGLSALDISAGNLGQKRLAVTTGTPELLVSGAVTSSQGFTPVRSAARGLADTNTNLNAYSGSARWQASVGSINTSIRLAGYDEQRGAGLLGAQSEAQGGSATLTLAQLTKGRGWRVQTWLRSSDLSNRSVAVAANRRSTTPASDQYSTPTVGYGFNAAYQSRGPIWSWEVGSDARLAQGTAHERFRYLNGTFTRGRDSGGQTAVGGLYFEFAKDLDRLLLAGGARIDAWQQSGAIRRERDLATGLSTLNSPSADSSGVTPTARFGARWKLTPDMSLRGASYAGFRPPTLNELHRPFRVGNDLTEANPELTPEKLFGAELGLSGEGALRWNATVFFNRLQDPITNVTIGQGPATFPIAGFVPAGGALRQRQNAGQIDAWGLEANLSGQLGPVDLDAGLLATTPKVDGGRQAPQLTGKRPAQTARLTLTAGARWQASPSLSLSAASRYESQRFEDDLNTRVIKAGTSLDLRAAWTLDQGREVYVQAENALDSRLQVGQTGDGVVSLASPRVLRIGFSLRR